MDLTPAQFSRQLLQQPIYVMVLGTRAPSEHTDQPAHIASAVINCNPLISELHRVRDGLPPTRDLVLKDTVQLALLPELIPVDGQASEPGTLQIRITLRAAAPKAIEAGSIGNNRGGPVVQWYPGRPAHNDDAGPAVDSTVPSRVDASRARPAPASSARATSVQSVNLRRIFDRVDANGDGHLTRSELIKALRNNSELAHLLHLPQHVREGSTRDRFQRVFAAMEVHGDGYIDWIDFVTYLTDEGVSLGVTPHDGGVHCGNLHALEAAPRGVLVGNSLHETQLGTLPNLTGGRPESQAQRGPLRRLSVNLRRIFARVDTSGDGRISRTELIKALRNDVELAHLLHLPQHIREGSTRDQFQRVFSAMGHGDDLIDWTDFVAYLTEEGVSLGVTPHDGGVHCGDLAALESAPHGLLADNSLHESQLAERPWNANRPTDAGAPQQASPATRSRRLSVNLRRIFARVDTSGDGRISRTELIKALRNDVELAHLLHLPQHIREGSTRDQFQRVFSAMGHGDDLIDWTDFVAYLTEEGVSLGVTPHDGGVHCGDLAALESAPRGVLCGNGVPGSGHVRQHGHLNMEPRHSVNIRRIFDSVDPNSEGAVQHTDLVQALRDDVELAHMLHLPQHLHGGSTRDQFHRLYDALGARGPHADLDWTEFVSYMVNEGLPLALAEHDKGVHCGDVDLVHSSGPPPIRSVTDQVRSTRDATGPPTTVNLRRIFDRVDTSGDGFISRAELIKALRNDVELAHMLHLPQHIREGSTRDQFQRVYAGMLADGEHTHVDWNDFVAYLTREGVSLAMTEADGGVVCGDISALPIAEPQSQAYLNMENSTNNSSGFSAAAFDPSRQAAPLLNVPLGLRSFDSTLSSPSHSPRPSTNRRDSATSRIDSVLANRDRRLASRSQRVRQRHQDEPVQRLTSGNLEPNRVIERNAELLSSAPSAGRARNQHHTSSDEEALTLGATFRVPHNEDSEETYVDLASLRSRPAPRMQRTADSDEESPVKSQPHMAPPPRLVPRKNRAQIIREVMAGEKGAGFVGVQRDTFGRPRKELEPPDANRKINRTQPPLQTPGHASAIPKEIRQSKASQQRTNFNKFLIARRQVPPALRYANLPLCNTKPSPTKKVSRRPSPDKDNDDFSAFPSPSPLTEDTSGASVSDHLKAILHLRMIFDRMDSDHNGRVSRIEFVKALRNDSAVADLLRPHLLRARGRHHQRTRRHGPNSRYGSYSGTTAEEFRDLWRRLDKDKNQFIEWSEFVRFLKEEHLMKDLEEFVSVWSKGHDDTTDIDWSFMQFLKKKGALSAISSMGARVGRRSSVEIHAAAQARWDRLRTSRVKEQVAADHCLFVDLVDLAVSQVKLGIINEDDETQQFDGSDPEESPSPPQPVPRNPRRRASPPQPKPRTPSPLKDNQDDSATKKSTAAKARWGLLATPVAREMVMQDPSRLQHDDYEDDDSAFLDTVQLAIQAKQLGLIDGSPEPRIPRAEADAVDLSVTRRQPSPSESPEPVRQLSDTVDLTASMLPPPQSHLALTSHDEIDVRPDLYSTHNVVEDDSNSQ